MKNIRCKTGLESKKKTVKITYFGLENEKR